MTKRRKVCKVIHAVRGKQEAEPGGKARSLSREQKDDNIIKLSFERDEKEKKDLSKLKRHDII